MKTKYHYGRTQLTQTDTMALQLEWEMVEQPAAMHRFLNFPCVGNTALSRAQRRSTRRTEKRALAA